MRKIVSGQTLDEAINNAMIELSITSDKLVYNVIQEGSSGFLGIGSKDFQIEAYSKDDKEEMYKDNSSDKNDKLEKDNNGIYEFKSEHKNEEMKRDEKEVFEKAKEFLMPIITKFNSNVNLEYTVDKSNNILCINLVGENMGVIIGKHGQTLDSLQHLTSLYVNKGEQEKVIVRIDSENYREKRNKTLEALAKNVASNVKRTKRQYALEPMSAYDRRIIHSVLQKERNIETYSEGNEKDRHVVVRYKRY